MTYIPPKPGQIETFEVREPSQNSRALISTNDNDFAPYTTHDDPLDKPLVSDGGRHRFTTQEEDVLIIRGSTSHSGQATIFSSVLNLTNTILGAGLLGMF